MDGDIKVDVEILRRDIDRLGGLFDRIDITIEKLTDVSNSINRMLAVHDNRLTQQEDLTRHIFALIEERRKETSESQEKITKMRDEIRAEIKESLKTVETKIDTLTKVVNQLDRWKYIVIGGGIVIGFILAETPILSSIFNP